MCGGGAHNCFLVKLLRQYTEETCGGRCVGVVTAEDGDWTEAMAFAWMAGQYIRGQSAILPQVTGAKQGAVLGALHKGKQSNTGVTYEHTTV